MRHGPWIPGTTGERLADPGVAIENVENSYLEPASIAPLGDKEKFRAAVTPPDAVVNHAAAEKLQPIRVPPRPSASRTTVEEESAASARQRTAEHFDAAASPWRRSVTPGPADGRATRESVHGCYTDSREV